MSEVEMADTSIDQLLRAHELVRQEIAVRLQMLEQHAVALHARLDALNAERKALSEQQRALELTSQIYRDLLPSVVSASAAEAKALEGKRPRARIGRQRYLMFYALRLHNGLVLPDLVDATGFAAKRVRDQMASDMNYGNIMITTDSKLRLTPAGLDLLERHEAYKRSRGEALPVLGERVEDDEDDVEEASAQTTEIGGTTEGDASAAEDMDFLR